MAYSEKYVGSHVCIELWDSGETHREYVGEVQAFELYPEIAVYGVDLSHTKEVDKWGYGRKLFTGRILVPFKTKSQLMKLLAFEDKEWVLKVILDTGVTDVHPDNPALRWSPERNEIILRNVIFDRGALPVTRNNVLYLEKRFRISGLPELIESMPAYIGEGWATGGVSVHPYPDAEGGLNIYADLTSEGGLDIYADTTGEGGLDVYGGLSGYGDQDVGIDIYAGLSGWGYAEVGVTVEL